MHPVSDFAKGLTNGTLSRLTFSTIIKPTGYKGIPRFGDYDEEFRKQLSSFITNLNAATGLIECRQAEKMAERLRHTRWGVDGQLSISGQQVAFTTEHPSKYLPPGEYPITLERMILCRKNGPMKNLNGEVCVGQFCCAGCVIKTQETFEPIYNRIQKALKRGTSISLIIQDSQC